MAQGTELVQVSGGRAGRLRAVSNAAGESKVLSVWDQPQVTANRDEAGIGEEFWVIPKEWKPVPK